MILDADSRSTNLSINKVNYDICYKCNNYFIQLCLFVTRGITFVTDDKYFGCQDEYLITRKDIQYRK